MNCQAIKRNVDSPFKRQNKAFKYESDEKKQIKWVVNGVGKFQPKNEAKKGAEKEEEPPLICVVTDSEIAAFFKLLDDNHIHGFLKRDSCYTLADKYLLAMVFVYFKRAKYSIHEFTRINFFVALYLAHCIEEDDEDEKYQILPWAFGDDWRWKSQRFFRKRDQLCTRMDYRAIVSLKTCEEYISFAPNHPAWQRVRCDHHSGAIRYYGRNCVSKPPFLCGPHISPPVCRLCRPTDDVEDRDSISSAFSIMTDSQFTDIQDIFEKDDKTFQYLFLEE